MQKIYAIEGLGGEVGAWLRTPLRKAGFDVKWFPWWWPNIKIPSDAILIGHSFGAARALKVAAIYLPKKLITIDARLNPSGGFTAPVECVNFYQTKFMVGYPVKGATNILVEGYRHTAMPTNPEILKHLK